MKFELKPNNRNASDEDILKDIKQVADNLGLNSLGKKNYEKYGRYGYSTVAKRFGNWVNALKMVGLEVENYHFISDEDLLSDLKKVSDTLKKQTLTQSEYKEFGKYSLYSFVDRFGSWFKSLEKAGLEKTRELKISTDDLFKNLEEVWTKLGRQPYITDIVKPLSKYAKDAYPRRFGSWQKALEAFVQYINENSDSIIDEEKKTEEIIPTNEKISEVFKHKTTRNINWRLRFIVMKRDNFKCKKCGRSPSTDQTVILHIDHMKPYLKGGETDLENLETLCSVCNLGKSDLE